jgi:6-pyruvoyltetrahydropterin/6-carboxytetrahydropterin synthase
MYELTIKTHFDAAHSLTGYPGECARLHGHSFKVDVLVQGEALNEIGILYDFKDLKTKVNAILDKFDHRHMNEIPPFDTVSPTAENLANYVWHELRRSGLPTGLRVSRVNVWESDTACISYYE